MLDLRLYRVAFLPLAFVLVIVAFSLHDRPRPLQTGLAPDAFDATRAQRMLEALATAYPARQPGSAGDNALAGRVASVLRTATGFTVRRRTFTARTSVGERTLQTVVAERPGLSSRQIVVLAHRDAASPGSRAELSGTAALLELAQVFAGRVTRRTISLVSTSGGSAGAAGAADYAAHVDGPVDAVIVLGDVAGIRPTRPFVVPWSTTGPPAPLRLQRTVEDAVRTEVVTRIGAARAASQFLRLAFPITVGEQGPLNAAGLPAVLLSASGEQGPPADEPTSSDQLQRYGRAALRAITALDEGPDVGPVVAQGVVVRGQVLPTWAMRLLVAGLLAPALLAALDAFFRVRRRHEPAGRWIAWALAGALPFLLAGALALALRAVGVLDTGATPLPPAELRVPGGSLAALGAVLVLGWLLLRRIAVRSLHLPRRAETPGPGAAVALTTVIAAALVWAINPFAAALLAPAAHLWLLAPAPEVRIRRPVALALVTLGILPLAVVPLGYGLMLHAGPLSIAAILLDVVAAGHVGFLGIVLGSVVLGCAGSALIVAARRPGLPSPAVPPGAVRSRGPLSYAGPGSLGGTDSALRRPTSRRA